MGVWVRVVEKVPDSTVRIAKVEDHTFYRPEEILFLSTQSEERRRREAEAELRREIDVLIRRVEGLREAVRRWRKKAGADPEDPEAPELVSAEMRLAAGGWETSYSYALPLPKTPELLEEARIWVREAGLEKHLRRLFFHDRHGWVAVVARRL